MMRRVVTACLLVSGVAAMSLMLSGCFGSQEEEPGLEASGEESAEATEEAPPAAPEPEAVTAEPDTVTGTTEPAAPPTAAPEPAKVDTTAGQKVVMFVKNTKAPIHAEPNANAKVVGNLEKGDHILVFVSGEWAQIADGKFVAVTDLTDKPVARQRKKPKWSK